MRKRNLNWMLDLVSTLSDMADETIVRENAPAIDAPEAAKVFQGIASVKSALLTLRERHFHDSAGEEGGEG